ncbi:MAG: septum formation initiator family protein [Bacteroidota bacterium]
MGWKEFKEKNWFRILSSTYVLVTTLFVIWMVFFDTNSRMIHWELRKEIKKLEQQKEFLETEIEKDREILEKLSKPEELEKYARENYYMKKDNEEIFLIEYEDSLKQKKNGQ